MPGMVGRQLSTLTHLQRKTFSTFPRNQHGAVFRATRKDGGRRYSDLWTVISSTHTHGSITICTGPGPGTADESDSEGGGTTPVRNGHTTWAPPMQTQPAVSIGFELACQPGQEIPKIMDWDNVRQA